MSKNLLLGLNLIIIALGFISHEVLADSSLSFRESKKILKRLYNEGGRSFYCNEAFNKEFNFDKFVTYQPTKKYEKRAKRVEWEHIVPAENFGRAFVEWREGHSRCVTKKGKKYKGRKCAQKVNPLYNKMAGDLINLVPAIGQVNALRSNYRYRDLASTKKEFGACDIGIEDRAMKPPQDKKGDIVRIYRYMEKKYGIKLISNSQQKLFSLWEKQDPISKDECATYFLKKTFVGEVEPWRSGC